MGTGTQYYGGQGGRKAAPEPQELLGRTDFAESRAGEASPDLSCQGACKMVQQAQGPEEGPAP